MVLLYFSLMASAMELLAVSLFSIYTSSSVKCPFVSFVHFLTGLFFFLLLSFKGSSCILDTGPLITICFANIFSQQLSFIIFTVFYRTEALNFSEVRFITFSLYGSSFWVQFLELVA